MQTIICAGVIVIVALCVELPQIYLQPFIADASDILIYLGQGPPLAGCRTIFLINRKTSNTQNPTNAAFVLAKGLAITSRTEDKPSNHVGNQQKPWET